MHWKTGVFAFACLGALAVAGCSASPDAETIQASDDDLTLAPGPTTPIPVQPPSGESCINQIYSTQIPWYVKYGCKCDHLDKSTVEYVVCTYQARIAPAFGSAVCDASKLPVLRKTKTSNGYFWIGFDLNSTTDPALNRMSCAQIKDAKIFAEKVNSTVVNPWGYLYKDKPTFAHFECMNVGSGSRGCITDGKPFLSADPCQGTCNWDNGWW